MRFGVAGSVQTVRARSDINAQLVKQKDGQMNYRWYGELLLRRPPPPFHDPGSLSERERARASDRERESPTERERDSERESA